MGNHGSLYRLQEAAIRSLYREVKERTDADGELLPGTPGTLVKRAGTGHEYWYRSYYPAPRKRSEQFVGTVNNAAAFEAMQSRIAQSEWTSKQVAALSKLGYLAADKLIAGVLVELHNRGIFRGGLLVAGALAYASWLNEYGAVASGTETGGRLELARAQPLKLATAVPLRSILQATQLPFNEIPGSGKKPSTSMRVGGSLTVDLVAPGAILGEVIAVPELQAHAQTLPFYGYLLEGSRAGVVLAGGHCIPVAVPDAARMIWYTLYMSTRRRKDAAAAEQDLIKAATLAAILIETDGLVLRDSYRSAPRELRNAAHSRLARLEGVFAEHVRARDEFRKLR